MLTAKQAAILMLLARHANGTAKLPPAEAAAAAEQAMQHVTEYTVQAAARSKPHAETGKHAGRRGNAYTVALGGQWAAQAVGVPAAVAVANAWLKARGMPQASVGSVQVTISRSGIWQRSVETDTGTELLSIQRTGTNLA